MIAGDHRNILNAVMVMLSIISCVAGCTARSPMRTATIIELPLTNDTVARLVLDDALDQLTLNVFDEQNLSVRCKGDSIITELVYDVIVAHMEGAGFRISENSEKSLHMTVAVDSLSIEVREQSSLFGHHSLKRQAIAAMTISIESPTRVIRSYHVTGMYHDKVSSDYIAEITVRQPSFVSVFRTPHPLWTYGKPLGFAVFMTVIVWSLYSYRG